MDVTLIIALVALWVCLNIEACILIELEKRRNGGQEHEEAQSA